MKTGVSPIWTCEMGFPPSSRMRICEVVALVFMRVSKLVLDRLMPGCGLPDRVLCRICCHVCWSVRTSCSVSPFICRCSGGVGGPFRTVWKTTFLRMPWDRKRAATAHSTVMSKRPASRKLNQLASVRPKRENKTNSRIGHSPMSYRLCAGVIIIFTI